MVLGLIPNASGLQAGLPDYGKNHSIFSSILVEIEITIIVTIIFELENMIYLFSMSIPKNTLQLGTL